MTDKQMICRADSIFLAAVLHEIEKNRRQYPHFDATTAVVTASAGELAIAMLSEKSAEVYDKAVRLAAMALKLAVDGDRSLEPHRDKRHLGGVGRMGPLETPSGISDLHHGDNVAVIQSPAVDRVLNQKLNVARLALKKIQSPVYSTGRDPEDPKEVAAAALIQIGE